MKVILLTVLSLLAGSTAQEWRPERLSTSILESTLVRYYVFGMRNAARFAESDETPEMYEIGPFTYREKRVKEELTRENNTTLKYNVHWSMHYLPELTGPGLSEDTPFTTINVPYITMAEGLQNAGLPKSFNDILMDEVVEGGERIIREDLSFGDSTFYGYNISLYTDILDDITQGQTEERYPELANGKFAFFKNKNNTVTGVYSVESTKYRPFGGILSYNGNPSLGMWPPQSDCDDVTGSLDFFTLPRNLKKDSVLDIFLPENCRKMRMSFVGEDVFRGIPVYVFKFPLEQFRNRGESEEATCYCLNAANQTNPQCLGEGLMDYSGCSKGAPLVGSFPHFLHANPNLLDEVKGLTPNKSLHESEVMVEPITGTPLYAVRRFQLNLRVHPIPTVSKFENMTARIIPLAWFEHILEVPSSTFAEVKEKLERLKMDKDLYEHDNPLEEVKDNTLFSTRSGFPEDSNKDPESGVPNSAMSTLPFCSFLVLLGYTLSLLVWTT